MNIWEHFRTTAAGRHAMQPLAADAGCPDLSGVHPVLAPQQASSASARTPPPRRVVQDRPDADPDAALLSSILQQTGSEQRPSRVSAPRPSASAMAWTLPGFERRCRVTTNFGELPIQALRLRDMVKVQSGAYREVQWIDEIRLDADFLSRHPEAQPVHLRAKALGPGLPSRNTLVSPAQVICNDGPGDTRKTGPAADFQGRPNIHRAPQVEITYYRFHCGEPVTVCVEGAWFRVTP
ncbi:Hint domain-containing protein [Rhodobacteraceae bacterium F11138]|nr:Hint domain-containing protein [Rhodobacteraceae bacterium F11138]